MAINRWQVYLSADQIITMAIAARTNNAARLKYILPPWLKNLAPSIVDAT